MAAVKFRVEFIATFLLVFLGTGSCVLADYYDFTYSSAFVSSVFGLTVFGLILIFGKYSGAHINPAVSIASFVAKQLSGIELVGYIIAQFSGAIAASLLVELFAFSGSTIGAISQNIPPIAAFCVEFGMTFLIGLVVFFGGSRWNWKTLTIASTLGLMVGLEAFFAGNLTGASMNPARAIAPAIVSHQSINLVIYIVAPILGCLVAGFLCRITCSKKVECC